MTCEGLRGTLGAIVYTFLYIPSTRQGASGKGLHSGLDKESYKELGADASGRGAIIRESYSIRGGGGTWTYMGCAPGRSDIIR